MDINKHDPEILMAFWLALSEKQRAEIVQKFHSEYNDFLNGNFKGQFSEQIKNVININSILKSSAEMGSIKIVMKCIELGANVHADDDESLRSASGKGHLEVIQYLVEKGANIHAVADDSLRWSSQNGHLEVVKYLVDKGANLHVMGEWSLKIASERGHLKVVQYLVEQGADFTINKNEPLRLAHKNKHKEVAKYLNNVIKNKSKTKISKLKGAIL